MIKKGHWVSVMFSLVLLLGFQNVAKAQEEITDEEILKYVSVMAQIDTLKVAMKSKTNDLVKGNELMDKGRVFNAIKKTKGDSVAIAALEISPEQLAAYTEITATIDQMTAEFKENYTGLIKNDLGASVYNKIKKGLKSDAELKTRYDAAVLKYASDGDSEDESQ
ncbi:MAG: hypothetical protein JXR07_10005 [Reichenbachiella sp.]